MSEGSGVLVLVGTPLGNRGDLSPRAREAILTADLLLCEDTRSPARLLGLPAGERLPPRVSCFAGNEETRRELLLERLAAGERVVYVSEAGMPVWSDPGGSLVRAVVEAGMEVDVIPGPTAVAAAVCLSGFSGADVHFFGFPPRAGGARTRFLQRVTAERGTVAIYEAGNRVAALLRDLCQAGATASARPAVVARELTKLHQEVLRGTVDELAARAAEQAPRGEVTIVLGGLRGRQDGAGAGQDDSASGGGDPRREGARAVWQTLCDDSLKPRQRAAKVASLTGLDSREVYQKLSQSRGR